VETQQGGVAGLPRLLQVLDRVTRGRTNPHKRSTLRARLLRGLLQLRVAAGH
jgi:hypothetical protein